jgi:stress response protein SCP2
VANDESTVCDAVNAAFADNPAPGCAVGLEGAVLSVVMRHQDLDTLPTQEPGLTPAGRPTLKTLTKRDRMLWWLTIMGSNLVATVKEALATAPSVVAVDLAVLTRLPTTQRLGVIAFGRWTRRAIESTPWREPSDALRFLDIGEDVRCALSATGTKISPLDISAEPGLERLVESAIEDGIDAPSEPEPQPENPYSIVPFERWVSERAGPPQPRPVPRDVLELAPGQNLVLPDEAVPELAFELTFSGAEADLSLLLLGPDEEVGSDADFVFYNQPVAAGGAARLLGKVRHNGAATERAAVFPAALPGRVQRVVVSINMDVAGGLTCAALRLASLRVTSATATWAIPTPADPHVRAMVLAEVYRHGDSADATWKLRAVGQGWAEGLPALARHYGVDIE